MRNRFQSANGDWFVSDGVDLMPHADRTRPSRLLFPAVSHADKSWTLVLRIKQGAAASSHCQTQIGAGSFTAGSKSFNEKVDMVVVNNSDNVVWRCFIAR